MGNYENAFPKLPYLTTLHTVLHILWVSSPLYYSERVVGGGRLIIMGDIMACKLTVLVTSTLRSYNCLTSLNVKHLQPPAPKVRVIIPLSLCCCFYK